MEWKKTIVFAFCLWALLLVTHECLLSYSGFIPNVTSDKALWALQREQVEYATPDDILLLGASRMQTNIDMESFRGEFKGKKVLQLALAGYGSSLPVFEDIVHNTDYKGLILLDESINSLVQGESQAEFVRYYHRDYSIDRKWNRKLANFFQKNFRFLHSSGNSMRLWTHILIKRSLPEPQYAITMPDRQQISYFELTDAENLYNTRMEGVRDWTSKIAPDPKLWLDVALQRWQKSLKKFQERGGRVIFIHMPVSLERWALEENFVPKEKYWDQFVESLGIPSIHFVDWESLMKYKLPDTSHLRAEDRSPFSVSFVEVIRRILRA